jgi:archaemetzincin
MKLSILIFTLLVFSSINCKKQPVFSLDNHSQYQIIAFQPLGDFDMLEIVPVMNEISRFFNKRVIVLKSIDIPAAFMNPETKRYSADSIILLLSNLQNDTIVEIVGLTNKPIFTIKTTKYTSYYDEKIFGMAHQPGNSCVVSDYRFRTTNTTAFNNIFRNVIIHETGHNLGLAHCQNNKCIMSGNNGDVEKLNTINSDYCKTCKKIINKP